MAAHPQRLLQHVLTLVPGPSLEQTIDAELLGRFIRDNDEDAFAGLVACHATMVLGVCRRVLRDTTAAEDVAQAAFLMLARKAKSIRRPETLAAWLHQTARHLALKYRRDDARRQTWETRSVRSARARVIPDPLEELTVRELLAIFDEELQRLPERYRLPLILCCLEGSSQEEAAHRLGWTPGSVKGRLERGRAMLHNRLIRRGVSLSATLVGLEAVSGASASGFIAATTRAALLFASGTGAVESGVAREVMAIAEQGIRSTNMSRSKVLLSFLLAVGTLTAGVAAVTHQGPSTKPSIVKNTIAPDQPKEKLPSRKDLHGDPLPAGALARLGSLRWRAAREINDLAFSPDGKTIAVGSSAGLYLFDLEGRPIQHICPDKTRFESIAFSPDGRQLACRCYVWGDRLPCRIQIWDVTSGRMTQQFTSQDLRWLHWSANTEAAAVFLDKETLVFRQLVTGKERRFEVGAVRFSSTARGPYAYAERSKLLAVPDRRGFIHIWDVSTGRKRAALDSKGSNNYELAFSPDGRWLASVIVSAGRVSSVQLWDVAKGEVVHKLAADQPYYRGIAFSPDDKTLVTVSNNQLRFHDVASGRERVRTKIASSFGRRFAFSPDSKTIATTEDNVGTIHLWNVATAAPKPEFPGHNQIPTRIAFSLYGRRVVTAGRHDGGMMVWNPTTGEPLLPAKQGRFPGCAFSSDGRSLFSYNGKLEYSDATTGIVQHSVKVADPDRLDVPRSALDMRLSNDGKTLVALCDCYPKKSDKPDKEYLLLTGWDVATRKQLFHRRRDKVIWHAVSADLNKLALLPWGGVDELGLGGLVAGDMIRIEDLKTGELLLRLTGLERSPNPQAFSPDGRVLVTSTPRTSPGSNRGADGSTLRLWELETAREVLSLSADDVLNPDVAFSADGRLLALTRSPNEILLWDLHQGKERQRFTGFDAEVRSLAFSPDGKQLVSGLSNSTLLVWSVAGERKSEKPAPLDALSAWTDLASDARKAFAARWALMGSPEKALPLLRKHLKPVPATDARLLRRLLVELDSDTFAVREKARKELEELGDRASAALQEALKHKPSLEMHRRIEALLTRLRPPITDSEMLRALRAIAVLEDIGTPEARKILETLAKGSAQARLTNEAKAALERIGRRQAHGQPR